MAFKSQAQRAKFYALKEEGKISQKVIDEYEAKTPKKIPERLSAKKPVKSLAELKELAKKSRRS